ncbi:uncharacterized protein C19orf44-like isoform X2 [Clytia hemisphaerica]
MVDDDKTPDISLSSSENLSDMDFTRLKLDSDEDEMRIDYMRDSKQRDINNNIVVSDDEQNNLMQNIQFAELQLGDVELSSNNYSQKLDDDFMPNVYTMNFSDDNEVNQNNSSDSVSSYNPQGNIKFMSSIETEASDVNNVQTDDEIKTESISSVAESEVAEILTEKSNSESIIKSDRYVSDFSSGRSSKLSRKKSTEMTMTSPEHRNTSRRKIKRRSKSSQQKSSTSASSRKTTSTESDTGTLSSTSSISSDSEHSKSSNVYTAKSSPSRTRRKPKSSKHKTKKQTHTSVQTDFKPNTADILNFKYPWQQDRPNNIAAQVVTGETLHVLTNYDPAVLAAHDMMKFHFNLLNQHIDNSRRLYEAYSKETSSGRSKYTTVEDTMNFIEKNRPKVQTYEEALEDIKRNNKDN